MNYIQLIQRLKRESGRSGAAPASAATLAGDDVLLGDWIADAWREVQRRRMDWGWMRKTVSGVLVQSQQSYTAAGDLDFVRIAFTAGTSAYTPGESLVQGAVTATVTRVILSSGDWSTSDAAGELIIQPLSGAFVAGAALGDGACNLSGPAVSMDPFGRWQEPTDYYTIGCYLSADPSSVWSLGWMPYEQFQAYYIKRPQTDGRPCAWSVSPTKALLIGPAPDDGGYSVQADYWASPTELALDADTPAMPVQFHMLLVWRALLEIASFDAAPEVEARAVRNLKIVWRDLIEDQAPRIQLSDVPLA